MALPSTSTGSNAWNQTVQGWSAVQHTGWSLMTSSKMSHTTGPCCPPLFGLLDVVALPGLFEAVIDDGLNSSSAIFFGNPHWLSLVLDPRR